MLCIFHGVNSGLLAPFQDDTIDRKIAHNPAFNQLCNLNFNKFEIDCSNVLYWYYCQTLINYHTPWKEYGELGGITPIDWDTGCAIF